MRKIVLVAVIGLGFLLSSCDPSGGKSFYFTASGEEVTQLKCSMTDMNARIDVDQLDGYTGGDIEVQVAILDADRNPRMDQFGAARFSPSEFEDGQFINLDMNPKTTRVKTWDTQEGFDLLYTCKEGVTTSGLKTFMEFTYYQFDGNKPIKIGYPDGLQILN